MHHGTSPPPKPLISLRVASALGRQTWGEQRSLGPHTVVAWVPPRGGGLGLALPVSCACTGPGAYKCGGWGHLGTRSGSSRRSSSSAAAAHPAQPRFSTKGDFASEVRLAKSGGDTPRGPSQGVPVASGERSQECCWRLHSPHPRPPQNQNVGSAEAGNQPVHSTSWRRHARCKTSRQQAGSRDPVAALAWRGVVWGPLTALGCEQ